MEGYESDKEQWEWVKAQVRDNGPAVLIAAALSFAAIFGWRWWQSHQDQRLTAAGAKYTQMTQTLEHGDRAQALARLAELERDYPGTPYTDQGRLLAARVYVDQGDLERAASVLGAVVHESKDTELANVARLRLARVEIAQGKPDAALATLGSDPGKAAFAANYHEVRGDAVYAKGDKAAALEEYRRVLAFGGAAPLLQLKIAEVSAGAAPAAAAAATK